MAKHHYIRKHFALRKLKKMSQQKRAFLVVLEGPNGSGKTYIAHRIARHYEKTTILDCRDAVRMAVGRKEVNWLMNKDSSFGDCLIIEDIEFLRGRDITQEKLAKMIKNWRSVGTNVVLSGVEIRKRLPKLMEWIGEPDLYVDLA